MAFVGRHAAPMAALVLLAGMILASSSFGFTWDERFQQNYGLHIWDYFRGAVPRTYFDTAQGQQRLYGGLVELLCVAVQRVVPLDDYVVRHGVVSAIAWVGIVFAARLASALAGSAAGWLTALFLVLSPRFFAHAMNNSKDAPFAAFVTVALYYTLTIRSRPPCLSWGRALALAGAIALAINVRSLGLVLIPYAVVVIMTAAVTATVGADGAIRWRGLATVARRLAIVAAIALPAGVIAWPWAHENPLVRPIQGFLEVSRLDWAQGYHVLYDGQDLGAGDLPWHYVPTWLALSVPPVVLSGVLLAPLVWRRLANRPALLALLGFALAPAVGTMVLGLTIHDGIRHLLFIMPPLFVVSAAGWVTAVRHAGRLQPVLLGVLLIGLAEPLAFQVRNHPNQIVYFSPLAGGPRAAFGRYDMDYWGNSVLQAVEWSARLAERVGMPLGVSGNPHEAVQADAPRYRALYYVARDSPGYHLDIRLLRGPSQAVRDFAVRPDILYAVTTADGTPLTVVLPGPAYAELEARLIAEEGDSTGEPPDPR